MNLVNLSPLLGIYLLKLKNLIDLWSLNVVFGTYVDYILKYKYGACLGIIITIFISGRSHDGRSNEVR